jgi:hypothetical protein
MGKVGGGPRPADRGWRAGRIGATAIGLLLVEWLLVGEVGPPMVLARTLLGLGDPGADPSTSLLALMTLAAEALVGYVLLVLALGSLATLPGLMGRSARRGTFAMTPAMARHLAGGPAITGDLVPVSLGAGQARWLANTTEPVEARPTPRRSAASLPPWLGGGPSTPAPGHGAEVSDYTVKAGDTLWDIAGAHLPPSQRSAATIHRYWPQIYSANRQVVGADPDLIHPGTYLGVAPFRQDRR